MQRMAEVPGGINLRHVAQTKLAMHSRSTTVPARTTRADFDNYFRISSRAIAVTVASSCGELPRATMRTTPARSITTVCGMVVTP